jgi:hypothetical protein
MTMSNRFDLEDKIMAAWSTKEDIELLFRNSYCRENFSSDDLANSLLGIASVHDMRMEELWDTFTAVFKLDNYGSPD